MNEDTHTFRKAARIPELLNSFIKNPISGGGLSSGHNFWFDRLSLFGILGIIPWLYLLYNIIRKTSRLVSIEYKYYYYLSMGLFISHGFIKASGDKLIYLVIFFLMPATLVWYSNGNTIYSNKK